jgi:hypothetical protein
MRWILGLVGTGHEVDSGIGRGWTHEVDSGIGRDQAQKVNSGNEQSRLAS